jgi:hypothetical protein
MAGPGSRLDDTDMLEYLVTIGSDSDCILESDTDCTSEEKDAPHVTPPGARPVSDSEEDDMIHMHCFIWCDVVPEQRVLHA